MRGSMDAHIDILEFFFIKYHVIHNAFKFKIPNLHAIYKITYKKTDFYEWVLANL